MMLPAAGSLTEPHAIWTATTVSLTLSRFSRLATSLLAAAAPPAVPAPVPAPAFLSAGDGTAAGAVAAHPEGAAVLLCKLPEALGLLPPLLLVLLPNMLLALTSCWSSLVTCNSCSCCVRLMMSSACGETATSGHSAPSNQQTHLSMLQHSRSCCLSQLQQGQHMCSHDSSKSGLLTSISHFLVSHSSLCMPRLNSFMLRSMSSLASPCRRTQTGLSAPTAPLLCQHHCPHCVCCSHVRWCDAVKTWCLCADA